MVASPLLATAAAAVSISPVGATATTFDRAYHAARPNQVVAVQPGAYPPQRLTAGGRPVVFAGSGRVRVGSVQLDGASNVEFRGMRIAGWRVDAANHVTFRNVDTAGAFFIDAPSSWISVIGGSVGPSRDANSFIAVPDDSVTRPSRHVLIDGVSFHDVSRSPGRHVECLMLAQGIDVTIRDSSFVRCSVFDLFVTWWDFRPAVGPPTGVVLEHDRFGHTTDGYFSILWSSVVGVDNRGWSGYTIRDNRCEQRADFASATPRSSFVIRRNDGC
ncbi:MAG TPA: hypothetical protein VFA05_00525 [Gaiellaceae bacterium]|nr:hypothetical protein [Gaiellaceae bacterium]